MAPEVFMHSLGEGHGRAADIWSVGCVIVEMGTGKVIHMNVFTNWKTSDPIVAFTETLVRARIQLRYHVQSRNG